MIRKQFAVGQFDSVGTFKSKDKDFLFSDGWAVRWALAFTDSNSVSQGFTASLGHQHTRSGRQVGCDGNKVFNWQRFGPGVGVYIKRFKVAVLKQTLEIIAQGFAALGKG